MTFQAWLQQAIARRRRATVRDATPRSCWDTSPAGRALDPAFGETTLSADEATTLEALLQRRQRGEPIAHLVGQREFWSLPLFVSPATLIPRPDTECLVEQALARLPVAPCRILDLGTGTGAIARRWPASVRTVRSPRWTSCRTPWRWRCVMPPIWASLT